MRNSSSTAICSDSGSSLNWKGWRSSTRSSSCIPSCSRRSGRLASRSPTTVIPGNHDYELACHPEYVDRLAEYNVTLEQEVVITRGVADRVVWIEHGQQRDPNNRSPDFREPLRESAGLPREPPRHEQSRAALGTRAVQLAKGHPVGGADDADSRLDDLPVFLPGDESLLRYTAVPFLLLFQVSLLYLFAVALDVLGIWSLPAEAVSFVLTRLSIVGGHRPRPRRKRRRHRHSRPPRDSALLPRSRRAKDAHPVRSGRRRRPGRRQRQVHRRCPRGCSTNTLGSLCSSTGTPTAPLSRRFPTASS